MLWTCYASKISPVDILGYQNMAMLRIKLNFSIYIGSIYLQSFLHFETLHIHSYSPLHNIRPLPQPQQYPAMLVRAGGHDDRVAPVHVYKYMAQLYHTVGKHMQVNIINISISYNWYLYKNHKINPSISETR